MSQLVFSEEAFLEAKPYPGKTLYFGCYDPNQPHLVYATLIWQSEPTGFQEPYLKIHQTNWASIEHLLPTLKVLGASSLLTRERGVELLEGLGYERHRHR